MSIYEEYGAFKGAGYIFYRFLHHILKRQFLCVPVCLPPYQVPSEMGSNLKGKNLLLRGANSFLSE